jgi:hypothetical protein
MTLENQVIKASGEKIECLVIGSDSIRLASKFFPTLDAFDEAWNKTLSLITKTEIKFSAIKSISKEQGEDEIVIKYKGMAGMPSEAKFAFVNSGALDEFYDFFQQNKGYVRTDENMSPLKAALPYLLGLGLAVLFTVIGYNESIAMSNGTYVEADGYSRSSRKSRSFHAILEMLGTNGVLLVGAAAIAFLGYKVWKRYSNPPVQTKLVPAG